MGSIIFPFDISIEFKPLQWELPGLLSWNWFSIPTSHGMLFFSCFLSFPRIRMNCVPPTLDGVCLRGWICALLTWEFLTHTRTLSRVPCPFGWAKPHSCPCHWHLRIKYSSCPQEACHLLQDDKAKTHRLFERRENSMETCTVKKCSLEEEELLEGLDGLISKQINIFLEDGQCWFETLSMDTIYVRWDAQVLRVQLDGFC